MPIMSVIACSDIIARLESFDRIQVLFDLAIAALKLGVNVSVATPTGYEIPQRMRNIILEAGKDARIQGKLTETTVPEEAIKEADIVVTDTW